MSSGQPNHIPNFPDIYPFFPLLNQEQQDLLVSRSSIVMYKKKDLIFRQNTSTSHIMIIISGLVKIYKEGRNNRVIILKILGKKNYLGLLSVLGDQIHQYSASAIEDADICFTDINAFRNIIMNNGKFALKLLQIVSQEGLFILDRLMSQTYKQLPGRIADVLLYFANEIYQDKKFTFPLTRRELAELAGTTKESFIRTLTEFRNDKIIHLDGAAVEIASMDIVQTLSNLG